MSYQRKTWREKLADNKGFPKVVDAATSKRGGTGTFVIPAPMEVTNCAPGAKGQNYHYDELRQILARRHGATTACRLPRESSPGSRPMQPLKPRRKGQGCDPLLAHFKVER